MLNSCLIHAQQSGTIQFPNATKFNGLKTEGGQLYYSAFNGATQEDKTYNIFIKLVNQQFESIQEDRIEVGYNSSLQEVISHKGGLVFYIKSGDVGVVAYYNKKGERVWLKRDEKDKNRYNEVKMESLGDGGIAVVHHHRADKKGFMLEVFNDQWERQWKKGIYPEGGKYRFEEVSAQKNRVSVIAKYKGGLFSGESGYRLTTFDAGKETVLYDKTLIHESDDFYPAKLKTLSDGGAFMVYYTTNPKTIPDTINFRKVEADGSNGFQQNLALDTGGPMNAIHPRPVLDAFQKRQVPHVRFHDIKKTGNGFEVLGETYYTTKKEKSVKSEGGGTKIQTAPPKEALILDYVTFTFKENGKLKRIHKQSKPHKRIYTDGFLLSNAIFDGDKLEKHNFFSYRFHEEFGGQEQVVNYGWHKNMKYVGFSTPGDPHENILSRNYTGNKVMPPKKARGALTTYQFVEEEDFDDAHYRDYQNVLPHKKKGKFVHYRFNKKTGKLSLETMAKGQKQQKANKQRIDNIPDGDFQGIKSFEDGGYYTWYHSEYGKNQTAYQVFQAFNDDLARVGKNVFQTPASARPVAHAKKGGDLHLAFRDRYQRAFYFYKIDQKGQVVQDGKINLGRKKDKNFGGSPRLIAHENGSLTMVQAYTDTAPEPDGVDVVQLNKDYNVNWVKKAYVPEGYNGRLQSVTANSQRVAVVQNQAEAGSWDAMTPYVSVWRKGDGEQLYRKKLQEPGQFLYPEFLQFNEKDQLRVAGLYFEGDDFDQKNSAGYFIRILKDNGKPTAGHNKQWETMEERLQQGADAEFLISGNVKVLIQDMVPMPDGSFKLIAELFQKSSGSTAFGAFMDPETLGDRAFSVLDFVVFDFKANGELKEFYKIEKPEQNILLPEYLDYKRGLSLSYLLRDYDIFSYRGVIGKDNGKLVYQVKADEDAEKRLYQTDLNQGRQPISTPIVLPLPQKSDEEEGDEYEVLGGLQEKAEELDKKLEDVGDDIDKAMRGTNRRIGEDRNPDLGYEISQPGEVLLYHYDPETYSVHFTIDQLD